VDLPAIKDQSPGTSPDAIIPPCTFNTPIAKSAGSDDEPGNRQASFYKIKISVLKASLSTLPLNKIITVIS
jgi:hypothetical protein